MNSFCTGDNPQCLSGKAQHDNDPHHPLFALLDWFMPYSLEALRISGGISSCPPNRWSVHRSTAAQGVHPSA